MRLARAAVFTYLGAAVAAWSVLVFALVTDRAHESKAAREQLLVGTVLGGESFGHGLAVLGRELERLGESGEIDPDDGTAAPEAELLRLTHRNSTFFNVGVAILDRAGSVVWAEPERFLARGSAGPLLDDVLRDGRSRIVPVDPDREDALVYVVAPIRRGGETVGALLGAIDLAEASPILPQPGDMRTLLVSRDGAVVVPAVPPSFASSDAFRGLVESARGGPSLQPIDLDGVPREVAISPVAGTDWMLFTIADPEALDAPATRRFLLRATVGTALFILPVALFAYGFRRTFRGFRRSEDELVRMERMRLLGEASNAIAHEVKNSLNGIRMGLDLVLRRGSAEGRIGETLRNEIQRLSDFSSALLLFSKGAEAKMRPVDLLELVRGAVEVHRDVAAEEGIEVVLEAPEGPVEVSADAAFVHAILANLVRNALDAISIGAPEAARVRVRVAATGGSAQVSVIDDGPGVAPEMAERIFEPFVTGKPSGVGIGLALARNLARAQGGELRLEPGAGGATFTLTLRQTNPEGARRTG